MTRDPKDLKPNGKRVALVFGCWALSPLLLLVLLVVGATLYNNFRLWRFERNFAALSHPAGTKFIRRKTSVGLFGNGNHCDFLVAELRSYTGNPKHIQNFYRAARVDVPNNADDASQDVKNGTESVEVQFLPSPLLRIITGLSILFASWICQLWWGAKIFYVVIILNSGESYSWDSTFCLNCG